MFIEDFEVYREMARQNGWQVRCNLTNIDYVNRETNRSSDSVVLVPIDGHQIKQNTYLFVNLFEACRFIHKSLSAGTFESIKQDMLDGI